MSPRPLALFRCDASVRLGGGHLRRCLTLAEALALGGWRIVFAMRGECLAALPRDLAPSAHWIVLHGPAEEEPTEIAAALGAGGAELLIVDHYGRDRRFETACRSFARRITVIDDLADRPHDADLLIDQTFAREGRDYLRLVPRECRLLCGSRYALLRPPFAEKRAFALSRRRAGEPVRRILIAMGAADADDLTSSAVAAVERACDRLGRPIALDVVFGAGAPHIDAVRRRLSGLAAWSIHVDASGASMAKLMAAADLAIGAVGTTSWERCCLGLPTIAVIAADNQAKIAAELAAAAACALVAAAPTGRAEGIAAAVEHLCTDDAARFTMAEAAAAVCDGAGTARVFQAIEAVCAGVSLEPVPA